MTKTGPADPQMSTDSAQALIRVMIVDDSVVIRNIVARLLSTNPAISLLPMASDGENAIQRFRDTPADVIILDIDMPVMDGLTAIPILKNIDPGVQIIMASTLTQRNAEISLRALSLGATDYIPKPSATSASATTAFASELTEKIIALGSVARRKGVRLRAGEPSLPASGATAKDRPPPPKLRHGVYAQPKLIAIGSSTGGPEALHKVVSRMGRDLPQPILITQHIPPTFTAVLAQHISKKCGVVCREARSDETLVPGQYYLAPGDFHLLIVKGNTAPVVKLSDAPREHFCRPAVDPMLKSLVGVYGAKVLTAILTGMGTDGLKGSQAVIDAGGQVIAQDEASSIVWGMPGAVAKAGLCSKILPIDEIGAAIRLIATRSDT